MCGIVGAVAQRDVAEILIEGLKRLEYRGYDSAGMVVLDSHHKLHRQRALGKVSALHNLIKTSPLIGGTGIAHTRWATHGKPSEDNAHPHISGDEVALVHNGIIENHENLRERLSRDGYDFFSETDSETVVHLAHQHLQKGEDFLTAVRSVTQQLEGAFAIGFIHAKETDRIIAIRRGSPLVVGIGLGENFIASDHLALLPFAKQFIYLEEGDTVDVRRDKITIYDADNNEVTRPIQTSELSHEMTDKGHYRHFMIKEIFEQSRAINSTLESRMSQQHVLEATFGETAKIVLDRIKRIQIVACGTSYHAGMVGRYWLENFAGIPTQVEIASEFRYRNPVVEADTLFVTLSQSGETADTLGALRMAKAAGFASTLAICNAPESSLVRESELVLITAAGPEIGVASTKAFTTQLTALMLLTIAVGRRHRIQAEQEKNMIAALHSLPKAIEEVLQLNDAIQKIAKCFVDKNHTLFLGRGIQYPIALEGALKLKEISYIHAEAYPAGELKHGPLALVDEEMPIVVLAPNDDLLDKLKSNLQEVRARGGQLIVFADLAANLESSNGIQIIKMPAVDNLIAPIVYTIPLQLLSYHVAVLKGTDVDQPRNLAKSVTVE